MGKNPKAKTLTFLVSISVACTIAWSIFTTSLHRKKVAQDFESQSRLTAQFLESRLQAQIQHWKGLSTMLIELAFEDLYPRNKQKEIIKNLLIQDRSLIAIRQFQKVENQWKPKMLITRPHEDPMRLGSAEIEWLDEKFPLEEKAFEAKQASWVLAELPSKTQILRWVIPNSKQAIVLEIDHVQWATLFFKRHELFSMVINSEGRLILQNEPEHFLWNENLKHLPIMDQLLSSKKESVTMSYTELPGSEKLLGSAQSLHSVLGDYFLVTQIPESKVSKEVLTQSLWSFFWGELTLVFIFSGIYFFHRRSKRYFDSLPKKKLNPIQKSGQTLEAVHQSDLKLNLSTISPANESDQEAGPVQIFSEEKEDEEYIAS